MTPQPGVERAGGPGGGISPATVRGVSLRARRRTIASFSLLGAATIGIALWSVTSGSLAGSHGRSGHRTAAAARYSLPRLVAMVPLSDPPGAALPALPFPARGEGAVAVLGTGTIAASKDEKEVPIASVTKMMTAYLVLKAHPLSGGEQGPSLHFTEKDHLAWIRYSEQDDSNVELVNGESLTERQLLEALLIPSADNVADILARWVGGTKAAFVAEMNATAASLGMTETHYADASGVDPHSVSTASDQALLASILMRNPVVRAIVALPDVAFPVEGHVWNYNPVLGVDGVVGVKSGFTPQALGCLVTAAWRRVGARSVLLVAAVTGQPWGLAQAGQADLALLNAATARLQLLAPYGSAVEVANVQVPWSRTSVPAVIAHRCRLAGWAGLQLTSRLAGALVTAADVRHGWAAGAVVGRLEISSQFGPVASLPVKLARSIAPPPPGSVQLGSPVSIAVAG